MKRILRRRDGDFDIYEKNDGVDYWRLVRACIEENIDQDAIRQNLGRQTVMPLKRSGVEAELLAMAYVNPKRLVLRMDAGGRRYVVKRAFMGSPGFKRLLPGVMGLTYFTRIMKLVDAAVLAGCEATQDCYLVAERWIAPFRMEVWIMLEYIDGSFFSSHEEIQPLRGEMAATARDLMRHGLTMNDVAPGNFLLSGARPRAIDISCRPFARLQKVKMAMKLNNRYDLGLPIEGAADRLLAALISAWDRLCGRTTQ